MKKIYEGKWSWNRRAILVRTDEGHILAASMHGMPHGGGAISWNNFPGHFCIHFKDSTTHRRKVPDPGHDLMISKASGQLHDRIIHSSPEELISLFTAAVNEQDNSVIRLVLNQEHTEQIEQLLDLLETVESLSIQEKGKETGISDPFFREIPVQLDYKKKGLKQKRVVRTLMATRGSILERWKLEPTSILDTFR